MHLFQTDGEKLQARYKDNTNVEWDFERENIISMKNLA